MARIAPSHLQDVQSHKTPGTPKFLIVRPMVDNEKISAKDQLEYLLGVDMLLYLVKHLHPDIANVTMELLKANDSANPAAYMEFLCVIMYVMNTKNLRLKIEPMGNFNNPGKIICDSDSRRPSK